MKKKKILLPRVPHETWQSYRKRGGAHGTPKGEKGYSRQKEKTKAKKEARDI